MSPPPLRKQSISILTAIFSTPAWQRLFKSLRSAVLVSSRLFYRTLYRCRVFLRYWNSKQSPGQYGLTGLPTLNALWPHPWPTYTVIRKGNSIHLGGISTSVYPFPGGSIGSTYRPAHRSRSGSPNSGQLTPTNRSMASFSDHPYSTSHSPTSCTLGSPQHGPDTDPETPQVEGQDHLQSPRIPQRQNAEVPRILVGIERPNSEDFTLGGPEIKEEFDPDLSQSPSLNSNPILPDVPGGSAALSCTRTLTRPNSAASSHSIPWDDRWDLSPIFPSESLRYTRRTKIMKKNTDMTLKPLDFTFETFSVPDGWTRHVHPEGCCYFYNESKRIFTDAEIYDPVQLKRIEDKMEKIVMTQKTLAFPTNADIVLNIYRDGDDSQNCQYFCLDHDHRVIFFLHEFHTKWVATWDGVEGAFSRNQLRYELESQYWYAVQMYPDCLGLSTDMIEELRDTALHLIGVSMWLPYSNADFTSEDLQKLLSVTSNAKENIGSTHTSGIMCILAQFMFTMYHTRFLNFHGESYARGNRHFSVYGDAPYRGLFYRSLSPLFFFGPDVYLKKLQNVWVDKTFRQAVWEETVKQFSTEWQDLVAFATILLNANIAFLAIQSVDQAAPSRSLAQLFSYASVFTNLGGMISGLLLIRRYRDSINERLVSANPGNSLRERVYRRLGIEGLAVMFSLPFAFLMWGSIFFLMAFTLMCLNPAQTNSKITVYTCLMLFGFFLFWLIYASWEERREDTAMEHRTLAYYPPRVHETDA